MSAVYDDILRLERPEPIDRPRMPMEARAAQFAPFAALVGYDDAVREVARETDERIELSDDAMEALNAKLLDAADSGREVEILYFVPDRRKTGGAYVTCCGAVKRLDPIAGAAVLTDGTVIPICDILDLERL